LHRIDTKVFGMWLCAWVRKGRAIWKGVYKLYDIYRGQIYLPGKIWVGVQKLLIPNEIMEIFLFYLGRQACPNVITIVIRSNIRSRSSKSEHL
jgi:hypothetical protein